MNDQSSALSTLPAETRPGTPVAVICIPTFRRPEMLASTLESVAAQVTRFPFAVVVIDNDSRDRKGLDVARTWFESGKLTGLCAVEEQQGNCYAINAAFDLARQKFPSADFFLMIDDDEIAEPDWLDKMVATAQRENADVVGGPVCPIFPDNVKAQFRRHPLYYSTYGASGPVPMIYGSGNCLIRRRVFETLGSPHFDLQFNFLGGGDTEFFTRCRDGGFRSYWVNEARIHEAVPPARLTVVWALMRSLRTGAINYKIDRMYARTAGARLLLIAKNLALIPASIGRAAMHFAHAQGPLAALHPMVVAIGRLLASLGLHPEPYRSVGS